MNNSAQMISSILELYNDSNFSNTIIKNNLNDRVKYSLDTAILKMTKIYKQFFNDV